MTANNNQGTAISEAKRPDNVGPGKNRGATSRARTDGLGGISNDIGDIGDTILPFIRNRRP